jgi:hypothetical protein
LGRFEVKLSSIGFDCYLRNLMPCETGRAELLSPIYFLPACLLSTRVVLVVGRKSDRQFSLEKLAGRSLWYILNNLN